MTAEPSGEDQMNAALERVLQQLQDAAAGPAADPTLVALHGVALVLADTRRLLGRPLATWNEDPHRTRPARPSNLAPGSDDLGETLDDDMADVAAADQRRRESNRRLSTESSWAGLRADPPRPTVVDRVAGTAPRGELEALRSQISQMRAADARFRRDTWDLLADALGGVPPAARYQWSLLATMIRHARDARLGAVVVDQAIQITELRTASPGPDAEADAGLDDRLDALEHRLARIEVVHRGFLAEVARVLGVPEGPAESLVRAVASTAADLKRERAKVADLEHHRDAAVKALAGLRAALTGALGVQGTTSDADAVGCVRQMMELLESTRAALDEARGVCARLAGRGPAEATLPIPEYCAMVRARLDRIAAAHEAGVERWRAEDPDRRTMVMPPSREELVAWLLDKIPTGTTPNPTPEPIARRTLRVFGVDEAQVAKACVDLAPEGPAKISFEAKFPEVLIEITVGTATDEAEAEQLIGALESELRDRLVTDWHLRSEDDLPNVPPGETHERVIAPQKFVVLRRVFIRDMVLVQLCLGADVVVPFELEDVDGHVRTYRPCNLEGDDLERRLIMVGAKIATHDSIAMAPGLEVRVLLRNDGAGPAKPRVALMIHEELMPQVSIEGRYDAEH